ncbi:Uu.00g115370.m01.CDS01 [Anthostomella pinea]|uniref:Uu.00g115370.m01.CDS01 n=1 Tax=Anthostomella pinea TaxID=933095 RepID=A0AAI8VFV5_9PEZI|nr:Uu.00g115370.m01.CDS01 [Anthostomella pinea]
MANTSRSSNDGHGPVQPPPRPRFLFEVTRAEMDRIAELGYRECEIPGAINPNWRLMLSPYGMALIIKTPPYPALGVEENLFNCAVPDDPETRILVCCGNLKVFRWIYLPHMDLEWPFMALDYPYPNRCWFIAYLDPYPLGVEHGGVLHRERPQDSLPNDPALVAKLMALHPEISSVSDLHRE